MHSGRVAVPWFCFLLLQVEYNAAEIVAPAWADLDKNPCSEISWQYLTWEDGKCYKIFSQGPCQETFELAYDHRLNKPVCRCPKYYYKWTTDGRCYKEFNTGPCEPDSYFLTVEGKPRCEKKKPCPAHHLFWPQSRECYPEYTQGPCFKGDLLYKKKEEVVCGCNQNELSRYYWSPTLACYQHYNTGPCETGHIFVYNRTSKSPSCTCDPSFIANYHEPSGLCYQLNTEGPCPMGHVLVYDQLARKPVCNCKENFVKWTRTSQCYREFTKGPCDGGQFLMRWKKSSRCVDNPCKSGYLFVPSHNGCYKTGSVGPCPEGSIVTFDPDYATSYRGICSCSHDLRHNFWPKNGRCYIQKTRGPCSENQIFLYNKNLNENECVCDASRGYVSIGDPNVCYQLKTEGPCSRNELLVFNSQSGAFECECEDGYFLERITNMCFPYHQRRSLPQRERKTIWTL